MLSKATVRFMRLLRTSKVGDTKDCDFRLPQQVGLRFATLYTSYDFVATRLEILYLVVLFCGEVQVLERTPQQLRNDPLLFALIM